MKVGLVGLGSIGRRHLGNLIDLGADVVAFDVSPEARQKAQDAYPHARYVEALPFAGLDALVIATPIENHLPWVEEAVARKLPFFVEKAIGTIEQLPRWREIAAMDLPVNQVGYNLRFHPFAALMHASQPVSMTLSLSWDGGAYQHKIEESSHEIDLAMWCGAPPVLEPYGWLGENCLLCISHSAAGFYWREWRSQSRDGAEMHILFRTPSALGVEMYREEMSHFVSCVRVKRPTLCPLSDGLRVLEVCAQIEAANG